MATLLDAEEVKKEMSINAAVREGLKYAVATGILSGGAVAAGLKYSSRFRKATGVSGRVALAISPPFFMFALMSELAVIDSKRNPRKYGITAEHCEELGEANRPKKLARLSIHHNVANWIYSHPIFTMIGIAVPTYGGIFYREHARSPNLKFSQKVMHTRVFGQAAILAICLGGMTFRDYMIRTNGVDGVFEVKEK